MRGEDGDTCESLFFKKKIEIFHRATYSHEMQNLTLNMTTVAPWEPAPFFDTGHRVALGLVALPMAFVWFLVWRCSPRKRFRINNPMRRLRNLYAIVAGTMVGMLAGHALPNALIGQAEDIKFLAFFVAIGLTVAVLRFMRACGVAADQIVENTHQEPFEVFDEETGDQMDRIATSIQRSPAATVAGTPASSYYVSADESSHEGGFIGAGSS
jgi:hypothetical protein